MEENVERKSHELPLVSVVMPVFNGEKHLREAIESILLQTYKNIEFIIVNDGSTDKSEEIILSFNDNRIFYNKNQTNIKLIKTLNKGFKLAKGKYIARMDADDISHPERFEKQVSFLELNTSYGLVGTGVNLIKNKTREKLLYHTDHNSLAFALAFYCPFIHPSVMFRNESLQRLEEYFKHDYLHAEDYELWTRIVFETKIANIPEYLLDYRIHDEQISTIHTNDQIRAASSIKINYLRRYFPEDLDLFLPAFKIELDVENSFNQKINSISKLFDSNAVRHYFEGDNLDRYLISYWKELYLESKLLKLNEVVLFFVKPITWKSKFTVKQLISIIWKLFR